MTKLEMLEKEFKAAVVVATEAFLLKLDVRLKTLLGLLLMITGKKN